MGFSSAQQNFRMDLGLGTIQEESSELKRLAYHLHEFNADQLSTILFKISREIDRNIYYIQTGEYSDVTIS